MAALKYYAQKDALGYPIPGTMMSVKNNINIPEGCIEIPAQNNTGTVRKGDLRYFVRHNVNGNIIPNSLTMSLERPSGLVYEVNPYAATSGGPNWTFISGQNAEWPASSDGYTLYQGSWSQYDDGETSTPVPYAGTFYTDGVADNLFMLSTNGYIYGTNNAMNINANQQDLYLTPGDSLVNGDTQNFWYRNTVSDTKWQTSILVYCGHCCGDPQQHVPYSYILNIYKDANAQYIETRVQAYDGGSAGPAGNQTNVSIQSQVWSSTDNGVTWNYLGFGKVQ